MAEGNVQALRRAEPPRGSPSALFVDLVRIAHGADFVASWLLPSHLIRMPSGDMAFQACEFLWDTIFATGLASARPHGRCWAQKNEAGVVIREDPKLSERFQEWGRQQNAKAQGRK